jgi:hypothetical protein
MALEGQKAAELFTAPQQQTIEPHGRRRPRFASRPAHKRGSAACQLFWEITYDARAGNSIHIDTQRVKDLMEE